MPMTVFVMTDGVRPDAIDAARCPAHTALRERGSWTDAARSVMPSVTLPCHMSIFHSAPPARHGVTTNLYIPPARPLVGLVEVLRAAGKRSAFIHNWEPLRDLNRPEQLAFSLFYEPPLDPSFDDLAASEGASAIASGSYDFVFVYLGSVDIAGHAYGWMSDGYLAQLVELDRGLGAIAAALPDDATIIVHSDHGGHDRTHGTEMDADMTIPWLAAGPTIGRGRLAAAITLLDTAPIIARSLGVAAPPSWEGRVPDGLFV